MLINKRTKRILMLILASFISICIISCKNNEIAKNETNEVIKTETTTKDVNEIFFNEVVDGDVKFEEFETDLENFTNNGNVDREINVIETKNQKGNDMNLYIDNVKIDVRWEDNNSVKELKEIIKNRDLIINTQQYGDFEQVGEIGQRIVSNNSKILAEPGDIVLYDDRNIVLFYGNNTWEYTKLGKIVGKTNEELRNLLGKKSVELKIN